MTSIPDEYRDLFETRSFAFVATLLPNGATHVTPTWVDFDGESVLVNTVLDNRKDRNVRRDPRVALAVADPENPYTGTSRFEARWSNAARRGPANTWTNSSSATPAGPGTPDPAATGWST